LLSKLTLHTVNVESFDQLQIPFRAVATNAETGEAYVFKSGNLAQAIRSSMSVPGAFPPVKFQDKLLIDGFLANNVPVEIVMGMGADIVIAVSVDGDLANKEKLTSLVEVTNQMIAILSKQNVESSLELLSDRDLLIRPELGDMSPSDFVKTPDAVVIGEEAALKLVDQIKRYSVSDRDYQAFLANQRQRKQEEHVVDYIRVTKAERVSRDMIKGRMKTKTSEPLNLAQLEEDLTNIYAIGDFETVNFQFEKNEKGQEGLVIEANEKDWGPNYLRFGLNLHNDTEGTSNYSLITDYRMTQLNKLGGEWKTVVEAGESYGIYSEFYQPLDVQNYYFIMPHFKAEKRFTDIYQDESRIAEYEVNEIGGGLDVGVNLRSYLEMKAGIQTRIVSAEPDIGATTLPEFDNIVSSGFRAKMDYDQLDDHKFPTQGVKSFVDFFHSEKGLGSDVNYNKIEYGMAKATTLKNKHILIGILKGGVSLNNETPFYDWFTLGGFLNLSGLGENQLRGQHKGLGQLIYFYEIADPTGFVDHVYLGGSFETGNVWADSSDIWTDPLFGGSAFIGVDTMLGPLYLGYGMAEGNDGRAYLYLGKTF
jgi:NTE family protein